MKKTFSVHRINAPRVSPILVVVLLPAAGFFLGSGKSKAELGMRHNLSAGAPFSPSVNLPRNAFRFRIGPRSPNYRRFQRERFALRLRLPFHSPLAAVPTGRSSFTSIPSPKARRTSALRRHVPPDPGLLGLTRKSVVAGPFMTFRSLVAAWVRRRPGYRKCSSPRSISTAEVAARRRRAAYVLNARQSFWLFLYVWRIPTLRRAPR